ncbi:MAG: ABC transporter permease [Pseudomonadota bacterium]
MRALTAIRQQAAVLHALMLREMITRYGRTSAGYLWALAEPVGFIALLSLIFTQITHKPPLGASFPLFYASGFLAYHWVADIADVTGRSVHVNRPLLSFPAITPLDTVLARFLLQALTGLVVAGVILAAILALDAPFARPDPAPLLTAFGLALCLGLGIGIFNVWAFAHWPFWERVWGILFRPVFLISCVFFTYGGLPGPVKEVLWWNPVIHLVGLMRAGLYPAYDAAYVMPGYVLALAGGLMCAGLLGLHRTSNRLVEP